MDSAPDDAAHDYADRDAEQHGQRMQLHRPAEQESASGRGSICITEMILASISSALNQPNATSATTTATNPDRTPRPAE